MIGSNDRWLTTAASLWERLDAQRGCRCQPPCQLGAEPESLGAVVQALGGAEPAQRWLARAGASERGIAAVLTPEGSTGAQCIARHVAALPWARCAKDALKALEALDPRVLEPPAGMTLPLFPEASAQLVREAARRVEVPSRPGFDAAFAHARVWLWRDLGRLLQHLLAADFQAFRAQSTPRFQRHAGAYGSGQNDGSGAYRLWLVEVRDYRARDLATAYPVLFRLLGEAIVGWSAAMSELFGRLESDWQELAATFRFEPSAALDSAGFGLSDPHHGGRQVVRLRVGDQCFYYKPRSLHGEELWTGLLRALAARPERSPYHCALAPSPLLLRDGYGYVGEAARMPIECHRVEEYHRELGAVLALFYAANGTDGHMQNLIVSHGHPVIVDLETVLDAPTAATELPVTGLLLATQGASYLERHSVASTGLLPQWVEWDDQVIDHSGIGAHATDNDLHLAKRIVVEGQGSMNLKIREERVTEGSAPSIPSCDGEQVAATDHVAAVVLGFQEGYRCIAQEHDRLAQLCATGVSSRLVRHVLRPTRRYAAVASALLAPRWLTSGVTRTAGVLQALHQSWMVERSSVWPRVVLEEARALDRGDIPLFSARIDDVVLRCGGEPVGSWFAETALAALRAKLEGLSESDLALQTRLIRLSFAARVAGSSPHALQGAKSPVAAPSLHIEAAEHDHIGEITKRLEQDAIHLGQSSAWLTLAYDAQTERYDYRLADHGIFSGSAGIAMFLSATSRSPATDDLALRALTHSLDHLEGATDLMPCAHALALLRASHAAAWLARCGLSDESLLVRLQEAIAAIEPSVLREDRHLDVLFGCASGLLASLRASEVFEWPRLLDCASVCSETLLALQQIEGTDAGGWRTEAFPERCITGFSHGAAGIVYALAAARAADDARVVRAIERGLQFESSCFDERSGTWRRWRDADNHGVSWCHGAPGIGLSRAGMIRVGWDTPTVREDLARALDATRHQGIDSDTFCCGAVGISELFLTAAEVLQSPELAEHGRAVLARTVLCRQPGLYELGMPTNTVCHPGLYQGWPGIAYGLLRSRGASLPSFALWDLPEPRRRRLG